MTATDTALIRLSRCTGCGACWTLSPYACGVCGSISLVPSAASGHGKVRAMSQVSRAPDSAWRAYVPYTLLLVQLDEGPTIMGHAIGDLQIGGLVTVRQIFKGERQLLAFECLDHRG